MMSAESPKNESKSSLTEISSPEPSLKRENAALLLKAIYDHQAAYGEGIKATKSKLDDLGKLISNINTDNVDWNYPDESKGREGCTLAYAACTLGDALYKTESGELDNHRIKVLIGFIRKILESSQEIHWHAGPQDNQYYDYGVTLAYQMLSSGTDSLPRDEQERMYRKFSKISPDKIDINAGPKNKQHRQYGATLAVLWCGIVHDEKRFLELPPFLTLPSQKINWEAHVKLGPVTTCMTIFSLNIANYDTRLLDKFLEHLRLTKGSLKHYQISIEHFGAVLRNGKCQTNIAISFLNFDNEHLNLLMSESEDGVREHEEDERECTHQDCDEAGHGHKDVIAFAKFFNSFLKFIFILNTIREAPKHSESLDEEERQIDTSKMIDHLETIDSLMLLDLCCFCAGVKFKSLSLNLAEKYFKKVSIVSPAYSQAQFELASFYTAISGALEINKVNRKKSLKKAFDAGTRHYFFQNNAPSDEKKSSTKESLSLVERISKSAIALPGEGMSDPILPEEFSTTLKEFKKSISISLHQEKMEKSDSNKINLHRGEIVQLKIAHLWDILNNHRNHRETNEKFKKLEKMIESQQNTIESQQSMIGSQHKTIARLWKKIGLSLENGDNETKKINPLPTSPSNTSRKRKTTSGPSLGLFGSSSSTLYSSSLPQATTTSQSLLNPEAKILEKKQKKEEEEIPSSSSSSLSFTNSRD